MYSTLLDVLEFHKSKGLPIGNPILPDINVDRELLMNLIQAELSELRAALDAENVVATADALGDLVYILTGAAIEWGIDLGEVHTAIHTSNMTKTVDPQNPRWIVKDPATYQPPKIREALDSAAEYCMREGFGDESWWPEPTVSIVGELPVIERHAQPHKLAYNAAFLARGAFMWHCPCGRRHEAPTQAGTRGGRAEGAERTCICGKHFKVTFSLLDGLDYATFEE